MGRPDLSKLMSEEFAKLGRDAIGLGLGDISDGLAKAAELAARGEHNDRELLLLCVWPAEVWVSYEKEVSGGNT